MAQTLALAINNADRNMMHKSRERKAILKWRNDRRNRVEEDRTLRLSQSKGWQIPDGIVAGKIRSQRKGRVSNGKCLAKIQSAVWVKRNGDSR